MTSCPRSLRTSSTHLVVLLNDTRSVISLDMPARDIGVDVLVISYTITATEESRMYEGISERNRSCISAL